MKIYVVMGKEQFEGAWTVSFHKTEAGALASKTFQEINNDDDMVYYYIVQRELKE